MGMRYVLIAACVVAISAAQAAGQEPLKEGDPPVGKEAKPLEGGDLAGGKSEKTAATAAPTTLEYLKVKRLEAQEVVAYRVVVNGQLRIVPARGQKGNGRRYNGRQNGNGRGGRGLSQFLKDWPEVKKHLQHLPDQDETRQIVKEEVQDAFANPPQVFLNKVAQAAATGTEEVFKDHGFQKQGVKGGQTVGSPSATWCHFGFYLLAAVIGLIAWAVLSNTVGQGWSDRTTAICLALCVVGVPGILLLVDYFLL